MLWSERMLSICESLSIFCPRNCARRELKDFGQMQVESWRAYFEEERGAFSARLGELNWRYWYWQLATGLWCRLRISRNTQFRVRNTW